MTSLLHISDTHFGTEQPLVMQAFEMHVQAHGADLVVFSGDITQRARRGQFASAQAFIQRIKDYGVPQVLTIPGNHDIPMYNLLARLFSPYGNYRRYIDSNLAPTFENDDTLIIGLNTTHPSRRKAGKVTARQVEEVAERLQRCDPQKLRIVVAHQPFGAIVASDRRNLQIGARAALERWASSGLDLVMGGHIHLCAGTQHAICRAGQGNLGRAGRNDPLVTSTRQCPQFVQSNLSRQTNKASHRPTLGVLFFPQRL
jgi:3',5'-cyclic AMP phosphodiesterase CpdA